MSSVLRPIPIESLHGRKDDLGRTFRLTLTRDSAGPISWGNSRSSRSRDASGPIFVPLNRLQQELDLEGRVNSLLVSERTDHACRRQALEDLIRRKASIEDVGLKVRIVDSDVSSEDRIVACRRSRWKLRSTKPTPPQ